MGSRIINLAICLITVVGLVYTSRARSQRNLLRQEHDALAAQFGSLDVQDPDRFYLTRVATDDPYQFAWRIYCPEQADVETHQQGMGGSGSAGSSGVGGERIIRVRFRWKESGAGIFVKSIGGSTTSGIGNRGFADFIQAHWDELQIQVMPIGESREFDLDQVIELLSVEIPKPLHSEARKLLGRRSADANIEAVLHVRIGTPEAFEAEAKAESDI